MRRPDLPETTQMFSVPIHVDPGMPEGTAVLLGIPTDPEECREFFALSLEDRARWLVKHHRVVVAVNIGRRE